MARKLFIWGRMRGDSEVCQIDRTDVDCNVSYLLREWTLALGDDWQLWIGDDRGRRVR